MVSRGTGLSAILLLAARALTSDVEAHGTVKVPAAEVLAGHGDEWVVVLEPAWSWEGDGDWSGGDQVGQFAKLSKANGYDTLRSYLEDKGAVCGYTNENATRKAIPDDEIVVFQHNQEGFTHQGPCEIWLDDTMVLHNDNCEEAYAGAGVTQSDMPVDFSSCTSDCMLRFYWLAFQNADWQVYSSGGTASATPAATTTPSPTPTTATPITTPTPTTSTTAPIYTVTPSVTTATPAPSTTDPSTSKCRAKRALSASG